MILYYGTFYSRETLIKLTGIRALHSIDDEGCDVKISQEKKGCNDVLLLVVTTKYFAYYKIKLDLFNLIIENLLIVSSGIEIGVAERCLKDQVKAARNHNFTTIELVAERRDKAFVYDGVLIERLWGFAVWGKYGFMMDNPVTHRKFVKFMLDHECPSITLIHHVYQPDHDQAKNAKTIWPELGFSWHGILHVSEAHICSQILFDKKYYLS